MTLTDTRAAALATGGGTPRHRRLVATFAITQTVGYGVLYYSFSVLLQPIARDLHASTATIATAMTIAILVTAAAAIPIGRWLDRHGGRALLTAGGILGVAAMLAWSQVQTATQLYIVFAFMGLACAMVLYEAAFAVIVATVDPARRTTSILTVTIVAGFASSIFLPLTGLLLEHLGWRHAVLALAAIFAILTVPAHLLLLPGRRAHQQRPPASGTAVTAAVKDKGFWLLAVAFAGHSAAVSAMGVLLVSHLINAGFATGVAATLAGLLGILSVTGRLTTTGFARRHSMAAVTATMLAIQAIGAAALPLAGDNLAAVAACITAFGLGFGVASIAKPAILADRYGTRSYATIAATMSIPIILCRAAAPTAAATLPPTAFTTSVALLCLAAAGALLLAYRDQTYNRRELPISADR
jgi:MFS family permease